MTGAGKPHLTAASLAQVPEGKSYSVRAPTQKVADEDDVGLFGGGLFDHAPAAKAASTEGADGDQPAKSYWTKEQDKNLIELKSENRPWVEISTALEKKVHECKERFKEIKPKDWKPKDWKPNNAKGGSGSKQKQGKQRNKNGHNQRDDEKKDDEKQSGAADGAFDVNSWPGGSGGANTEGGIGNEVWGFNDSGEENDTTWGGGDTWGATDKRSDRKTDANNEWAAGDWDNTDNNGGEEKEGEGFNDNGTGWVGRTGDNAATGGLGDNNDTGGNTGGGDGAWNNERAATANNATDNSDSTGDSPGPGKDSSQKNKGPSNKAPFQSGSNRRSSRGFKNATSSKEYELKPDSTFSANDLRLVAKILQQDCSMVWNRVSWRFKDKTDRNLHPDVFEEKIIGKIEGRGSDRGHK